MYADGLWQAPLKFAAVSGLWCRRDWLPLVETTVSPGGFLLLSCSSVADKRRQGQMRSAAVFAVSRVNNGHLSWKTTFFFVSKNTFVFDMNRWRMKIFRRGYKDNKRTLWRDSRCRPTRRFRSGIRCEKWSVRANMRWWMSSDIWGFRWLRCRCFRMPVRFAVISSCSRSMRIRAGTSTNRLSSMDLIFIKSRRCIYMIAMMQGFLESIMRCPIRRISCFILIPKMNACLKESPA